MRTLRLTGNSVAFHGVGTNKLLEMFFDIVRFISQYAHTKLQGNHLTFLSMNPEIEFGYGLAVASVRTEQ
jgi:hypothetical protein